MKHHVDDHEDGKVLERELRLCRSSDLKPDTVDYKVKVSRQYFTVCSQFKDAHGAERPYGGERRLF